MVNRSVLRSPDWHGSLKIESPQGDANLRNFIHGPGYDGSSDFSIEEYERIQDLVAACETATISTLDVAGAFVVSIGHSEKYHLYLV